MQFRLHLFLFREKMELCMHIIMFSLHILFKWLPLLIFTKMFIFIKHEKGLSGCWHKAKTKDVKHFWKIKHKKKRKKMEILLIISFKFSISIFSGLLFDNWSWICICTCDPENTLKEIIDFRSIMMEYNKCMYRKNRCIELKKNSEPYY